MMNQEKVWGEVVVACFKVLSYHSREETEEKDANCSQE
jgi:hypothetical protein